MDQATLFRWATELGFGHAGVCSVQGFEAQEQIVNNQPPLAQRRQLRYSPQKECPWARALLVLLWPYPPARVPETPDEVFVDSYYSASNSAYHAARELESRIQNAGYRAQANVSFPAREAAVRAGLGIIGHHGLLISKAFGTRVVIILLATDAVDGSASDCAARGNCIQCGRCIKACPTHAIDKHGISHPERCLRNYTMEGVVIPEETRILMGNTLIGCDRCQRSCPMQPATEPFQGPVWCLSDFMTDDAEVFKASAARLAEEIGRNAARPQRIRAQAAVLAGNQANPNYLPVLRAWSQSEFDAVRLHAQWAEAQLINQGLGLDQTEEKR